MVDEREMQESAPGMNLYVWPRAWGSPSVCQDCLAVMAYCKFSKVNIDMREWRNPWTSPSGSMPSLEHKAINAGDKTSSTVVGGVSEIFDYLRRQNLGADHELTTAQSADVYAYFSLLRDKLRPALVDLWWVNTQNYVDVTRPQYAKILPFPLGMIIPSSERRKRQDESDSLRPSVFTDSEWENKLRKSAQECLNILSEKLGQQDYFFGKSPTSFDAVVFGYLAPLYKAPVTDTVLKNHLRGCSNLVSFISRILDIYFPLSEEEILKAEKEQKEARKKEVGLTDFPNRRRNMVLAALVALCAMAGYAILSGLVQIEIVSDDKPGDDDEESESPPDSARMPNFNQFDKLFEEEDAQGKRGDEKET